MNSNSIDLEEIEVLLSNPFYSGNSHPLRRNRPMLVDKGGWEVVKIYEEVGSGANNDRPAYKELLKDVKEEKYDVVGVFKFDRFARSTQALLSALEEFRKRDIQFFSLQEQVDTGTPTIGRRII